MLDPEPSKLDCDRASAGIAGFADPLVALGCEWLSESV
jgi:hypothetical protein